MRKELLMLALLVLVVGCTPVETPITPITENPAPITTPTETTPATTKPVSAPVANTTVTPSPIVKGEGCNDECMSQCIEDSGNSCGFASDYTECVSYCGTTIRPQGCKGACASGNPIECSIIFEGECKKDCAKICA